jgi:hypothetical protein
VTLPLLVVDLRMLASRIDLVHRALERQQIVSAQGLLHELLEDLEIRAVDVVRGLARVGR